MAIYVDVKNRIYADIDNECIFDSDIVGLTFSGKVKDYSGNEIILHAGDYIYLYTPSKEDNGENTFIFSEGYVIPNPYKERKYIWCCKLTGKIEYFYEYRKRFNK